MKSGKNIYEYNDYRLFLKETYEALKAQDEKYSYRYFAKEFGAKAPNFLKRIIEGERNLSSESIENICKAFEMNNQESFFFKNLVLFNQATNAEEKKIYSEHLVRTQGYKKFHPLGEEKFSFYANWYYIPILEMLSLPSFREDPEWIAKRLRPNIKPGEAQTALDKLQKLKLIERTSDGKLKAADVNIETADEVESGAILHYHQAMIQLAGESLDRFAKQGRDVSALTFRLSSSKVLKVKEIVQRFRKEIGSVVADDPEADRVYQLNFQLFPLVIVSDDEAELPPPPKETI